MRNLLFLSAIILISVSCTHQKEIEQYQKQLKESNGALEEVINYRKLLIKSRAVENPGRALKWQKATVLYDSICQRVIHGKLETNSATLFDLQLISDTLFSSNKPADLVLSKASVNDTLLIKNIVLNHLNKWLQRMAITTDPNFCGFTPFQIKPTYTNVGDSTLINIASNFCLNQNKFVVNIQTPDNVDFINSHSLGHFFLQTEKINPQIIGEVEFMEHSAMRAFKLSFNNDTTYFVQ